MENAYIIILFSRFSVFPPEDGAKWGSVILGEGNTSTKYTGLYGDMFHARYSGGNDNRAMVTIN